MMRTEAIVAPVEFEAVVIADPRLIEEIHAQRGQALFGFARSLGLTDDQAADAVQETLLRLWSELAHERSINDPVAWAFRTIYRISMDEHRLRRRLAGLRERIGRTGGRPTSTDSPRRDEKLAVWAQVDLLPARQRHALYLRYQADLPFDEIGLILDISAGGARTLVSRAVDRIRRELAEDGGE